MDNFFINGCIISSISKKNYEIDVLYEQKNVIKLLENDGTYLEFVRNQTEALCKIAILQNWSALKFVKDQTHDLCVMAININPHSIQYIKKLNIHYCVDALRKDESVVCYIKDYLYNYGK